MRARAHDLHDDSYPRNYPYKGKHSVEEKKLSFLRSFVFLTVNLNWNTLLAQDERVRLTDLCARLIVFELYMCERR